MPSVHLLAYVDLAGFRPDHKAIRVREASRHAVSCQVCMSPQRPAGIVTVRGRRARPGSPRYSIVKGVVPLRMDRGTKQLMFDRKVLV
jgi:hypothetical protein